MIAPRPSRLKSGTTRTAEAKSRMASSKNSLIGLHRYSKSATAWTAAPAHDHAATQQANEWIDAQRRACATAFGRGEPFGSMVKAMCRGESDFDRRGDRRLARRQL